MNDAITFLDRTLFVEKQKSISISLFRLFMDNWIIINVQQFFFLTKCASVTGVKYSLLVYFK
jgi:hypothetical protein